MDYREKNTITKETATQLWHQSVLSISGNYEKSPEVLKINDTVIGTLGNFSASIGKAKSKKTFNLSALVASALSDEPVLCYSAALPTDKNHILYVDTEQSPYHCLKVMKRIFRLAGLPTDTDCDRFQFLALRKYTPDERLSIVETAIYETANLGLVVIDGIRDMVYDINSPSEATSVISKLMQWTDERQIHLHTILHQNKGGVKTHVVTLERNLTTRLKLLFKWRKTRTTTTSVVLKQSISALWSLSHLLSASIKRHCPNLLRTTPSPKGM